MKKLDKTYKTATKVKKGKDYWDYEQVVDDVRDGFQSIANRADEIIDKSDTVHKTLKEFLAAVNRYKELVASDKNQKAIDRAWDKVWNLIKANGRTWWV